MDNYLYLKHDILEIMNYKKSLFIAYFATLLFVFGFLAYSSVNADDKSPLEMVKSMAIDDTRTIIFALNFDGTLSAYNFADNKFIIARKELNNAKKPGSILISQDGSKLAVFSSDRLGRSVSVFNLNDILTADSSLPTATYSFPILTTGRYFGKFSENGKEIYMSYGENKLFVLDTEKNSQNSISVGDIPLSIELDKSGNIFVLNAKSETVSKVDVKNKSVTATIKVGSNPKEILFNDITKQVYVSHIGSDDVYVIDSATSKVVKIIQLGGDPTSMTYDKTSGDVFVASNSSGVLNTISPDFRVSALNLQSTAYFKSAPLNLFYSEIGKKLFILNSSSAELLIYDTSSRKVINKIITDYSPIAILGSEKLALVFINHFDANSIYEVNAKTYSTRRIPEQTLQNSQVFSKPQGILGDPDTNRVFVTNLGSDKVQVIDGSSLKVLHTITVARSPQAINIQPVTKKLYTYSPSADSIAVTDITKSDYPTKIIEVGKQPFGITINSKTNKIYIAFAGESQIGIMDGDSDKLIGRISLPQGSFPLVAGINENRNKLYWAAYGHDFIAVISGETDKIKKQITVGQNPIWVAYNPWLDLVFVTVEGAKKIVVIDPENDEIVQEIKISAVPYRIFFDEKTNYVYVNHRNESVVTVLRQSDNSRNFEVVKEKEIAFWGQTDMLYNMVWLNRKTNFAYFTFGGLNRVDVIKNELDSEGIRKPIFYATIDANGNVIFFEKAKTALKTDLKTVILSLPRWTWFAVFIIIIFAIVAVVYIRRKSNRKDIV